MMETIFWLCVGAVGMVCCVVCMSAAILAGWSDERTGNDDY